MSIFIALPCYGGLVCEKTTMSLFNLGKLFVREGVPHGLFTVANSSLISQGRSKIANFFPHWNRVEIPCNRSRHASSAYQFI